MAARPDYSIVSEVSLISGVAVGDDKATQKYDRWGSALLFSFTAVFLLLGLMQQTAGWALLFTAVAFIACAAGLALPPVRGIERLGDRPVVFALAVALVIELAAMVPAIHDPSSRIALVAAAVIAGSNLSSTRWLGRWQIPLLCAAHIAFNILRMMGSAPAHGALTAATSALVAGNNPYLSGNFHDLPLPVLLSVPSQLFERDPLASLSLATTAAGALLAYARPGRVGGICAALLMLLPQTAAAIDDVGVEPFVVLFLAGTVFCACRRPKWFPFVLGLLFATKLYLVLALPAVLVLSGLRINFRTLIAIGWKALLTAAVVIAPFVLWNPGAFAHSVFSFEGFGEQHAPTLLSWIRELGGPAIPGWISVVIALALIPLVVGRAARTSSGFAAGIGLIYFGLFAFSAHAAPSQYALVLGALYVAIGATGLPGKMDEAADVKSVYFKNS